MYAALILSEMTLFSIFIWNVNFMVVIFILVFFMHKNERF
jgi:hypothetical protein